MSASAALDLAMSKTSAIAWPLRRAEALPFHPMNVARCHTRQLATRRSRRPCVLRPIDSNSRGALSSGTVLDEALSPFKAGHIPTNRGVTSLMMSVFQNPVRDRERGMSTLEGSVRLLVRLADPD